MIKILISAAEPSSDAHGAALIRGLKSELSGKEPLEFWGIGGPKLQAEGLQAVVDARELSVMGTVEVLGRLPRILRAVEEISQSAAVRKPDIAVLLDYPGFHFRLARRLKSLGIPMIYYIPPKVWVWKKNRLKFLKEFFNRILCIFPFEESFYKDHSVAATYVGNPLVDELPLQMTQKEARQKLGIEAQEKVLVLMPGSRTSELKNHLELMLNAADQAIAQMQSVQSVSKFRVLLPFPDSVQMAPLQERIRLWQTQAQSRLDLRVSQGDAPYALLAADWGLIKSGTSTLEAGLLQCPHAVVYKPAWITGWIFQNIVRFPGPVGLVNLVAGWKAGEPYLVREILCGEVTQQNLAAELLSLFQDQDRIRKMKQGFLELKKKVLGSSPETSPSRRAAQEILSEIKKVQAGRLE